MINIIIMVVGGPVGCIVAGVVIVALAIIAFLLCMFLIGPWQDEGIPTQIPTFWPGSNSTTSPSPITSLTTAIEAVATEEGVSTTTIAVICVGVFIVAAATVVGAIMYKKHVKRRNSITIPI